MDGDSSLDIAVVATGRDPRASGRNSMALEDEEIPPSSCAGDIAQADVRTNVYIYLYMVGRRRRPPPPPPLPLSVSTRHDEEDNPRKQKV